MHIFLYEYTSACPDQAGSLHAEGRAMLQAVIEDFGQVPGVETLTLLNETRDKEEEAFRRLASAADFALVIAPEFDDILASRCRWVLEAGGRLLGPSPEAVTLAADKFLLASRLREASIPHPPTILLFQPATSIFFPAVCKPRFGAGSQATFLVPTAQDLEDVMVVAGEEMPGADFILQRFMPGLPASVTFLVGPTGMLPLLPTTQDLSDDDRFRYLGGEVPISPVLDKRVLGLASRALAVIPGLLGYIGVDLVLGFAANGSEDYLIEINPRLTTSYIGLRKLAQTNLAQALLDLMMGNEPAPLEWRPGKVSFQADGTVPPS